MHPKIRHASLFAATTVCMLCMPILSAESFHAHARYGYYTTEQKGQILVRVPDVMQREGLTLRLWKDKAPITDPVAIEDRAVTVVPVNVGELTEGTHTFTCKLRNKAEIVAEISATVTKLAPKANAVKIDRLTGGLIVDGLPFIPFGFYCYSPVQPTLAEEEVVKGFNMMSPYQNNTSETLEERRHYMDRCAALGMKVHYQILSVADSGGVLSSDADIAAQRRATLEAEVTEFRGHPALLAWYIADEPTLGKISTEVLAATRAAIKRLDPYHPVTVVFMKPDAAREYEDSMDVVMTDVYPVPHAPVTQVADATVLLKREFVFEKPIWYVPQAFGGNEWWRREPTTGEQRAMTYMALVNGATGIQYFIRAGLNSFPKSTSMWAECGRLALETAELTPALLSAEPRPAVSCSAPTVQVAAWRNRGAITVIAVNTEKTPVKMKLRLRNVKWKGEASVLFEDRTVNVKHRFFNKDSAIEDLIDGFGTRVYRIPVETPPGEDVLLLRGNRMLNPSFEVNPSVGTPAGCYANAGAGRGATYFVDSRVAKNGMHSLRVHVPKQDEGCSFSFYPTTVAEGKPFRVSLWAKGQTPGQEFTLALGGLASETFAVTQEWSEYVLEGMADQHYKRISAALTVQHPGTTWFDLLQIVTGRHVESADD